MSWIAVAIGGSAALGFFGSKSAANTQADAARDASGVQKYQYDTTRADLAPYRRAGTTALSQLQSQLPELTKPFGMEDFQESPAYQFNLQEGERVINKAANQKGNLYAPQTLQDIGKYSQGVASNEFQNAYSNYNNNLNNIWNRLYGLVGTGQSAANQTGAFGANAANNIASNTMGAANAQAAGTMGGVNAIAGGIGDAYNNYLLSTVLKGQAPSYGLSSGGNYSMQG